jgi:hypothetical protein
MIYITMPFKSHNPEATNQWGKQLVASRVFFFFYSEPAIYYLI